MGTTANIPSGGSPEKYRSTEVSPTVIDFYVDDVEGDDGNDGLTALTPFKTMGKAHAETVNSGVQKFIYIFAGTYNENLVLSTLLFTETHAFAWYFETRANYFTTIPLITSPAAHFFDAPVLDIQGNGRITYTGSVPMIDTSDAFFSVLLIQCNRCVMIATALLSKGVVLGDISDGTINVILNTTDQGEGVFGFGSVTNVAFGDYFIHSEDPQLSGKVFDVISITGGITATTLAGIYFCGVATIPEVFFNFYSRAALSSASAEGFRCEAIKFDFACGEGGGHLGTANVKALGSSTSNQIRIQDQQTLATGVKFESSLECNQGFIEMTRCYLNTGIAGRSIKMTGVNSRLNIRDSIVSMPSPAIDCSDNAGTTINIYDSTIATFSFGSNCVLLESPDTLILNCKFKAGLGGKAFVAVAAPAIQISNSISNVGLTNVTDPNGGLDIDAAYDDIILF